MTINKIENQSNSSLIKLGQSLNNFSPLNDSFKKYFMTFEKKCPAENSNF